MAFVLQTLRGHEALDPGGFCVGFLAFAFGLDFAADDEFADLESPRDPWFSNDIHVERSQHFLPQREIQS